LIRDGAVQLIPREAASSQIADALVAAARRGSTARPVDFEAWWELAAASVSIALGSSADDLGSASHPSAAPKVPDPECHGLRDLYGESTEP
jgi:hypothetical protein